MKIVLFSRVPRIYSFRHDRVVERLTAEGHEVIAIVAETVKTGLAFREWLTKLGPKVVLQKCASKTMSYLNMVGRKGDPQVVGNGNATRPPKIFRVGSHNDPDTVSLVRSLSPDIIVLRGCGIIKKPILEIPRLGTLNPHYGKLPTYRGMDVTEWAVLHGDNPYVTIHFVSEGVDTGEELAFDKVAVKMGDSLGQLRNKSAALAIELFAQVLKKLVAGELTPQAHDTSRGHQYFSMHPRLRRLAEERLQTWEST